MNKQQKKEILLDSSGILIPRAVNGYVIEYIDYNSDEEIVATELIEVNEMTGMGNEDYTDEEKEGLTKLINIVLEQLGYYYDKYRGDNVNIKFDKKGHKLE